MNELFASPGVVNVGARQVIVAPFSLRELLSTPLPAALPSDLVGRRELVARLIRLTPRALKHLTAAQLDQAIADLLEINPDLYQETAGGGPAVDWPEQVQLLVQHGHPFDRILDYTPTQIRLLITAIRKLEKARLAGLLTVIATGAQGTGKAVGQMLRELDENHSR